VKAVFGILLSATFSEVFSENEVALAYLLSLHEAKLGHYFVLDKQKPKKVKVLPHFGLFSFLNFAIILQCQNINRKKL
jgi:hypothetical protein